MLLTIDIAGVRRNLLYTAPVLHWGAVFTPTTTTALRLEVARRQFDYRGIGFDDFNGALTEANVTGRLSLPHGWTSSGRADVGGKHADDDDGANAYRYFGARLGMAHGFSGWADVTLIASARRRDHLAYSELLDAVRRDRETNPTAVVRVPKLRFAALTPNILVQHNRVECNVDSLYSFRRTALSIRLDDAF